MTKLSNNTEDPSIRADRLSRQVGSKADRKLRAQRKGQHVWFGLGMLGLIGWSVAVPTLAGAAIGLWIDKHHPGGRSWTLALLVAGLMLGCANAWRWVSREHKEIQNEEENNDERK
jgi:ATP synthase protein I